MKRVAKWVGISVAGLLALVVLLASGFYTRGRLVAAEERAQPGTPVAAVSLDDTVALARGEHVVQHVAQCVGCHAPDLGGADFIDDGAFGYVPATNLTAGRGGVAEAYDVDGWERAIRHGVAADGRGLFMMPSHQYQHMSDADLGAVVAYLRTVPPVDREFERRRMGPVAGILTGLGQIRTAPDMIDHEAVGTVPAPPEGPTVEYGRYLVTLASCADCHGENLDGVPSGPGPPPAPNITAANGGAGSWTVEQFRHAFREGEKPDGSRIDAEHMPWPMYGRMTDVELEAISRYLSTRD